VIGSGRKLVRIKELHDSSLPSCTNALLSCFSSCEDLDMHHVVLLLAHFVTVIDSRVEDEVTRLHFLELEINRESVVLVSLVPPVKLEAKLFPKIVNNLSY
jgi:hypothetical protein